MSVNKVEGHFSPGMIWHRLVGGCTSLFFFFCRGYKGRLLLYGLFEFFEVIDFALVAGLRAAVRVGMNLDLGFWRRQNHPVIFD